MISTSANSATGKFVNFMQKNSKNVGDWIYNQAIKKQITH